MAHPNLKYDWKLVRALYLRGMHPDDIVKLPECKGMTVGYLSKTASQKGWNTEKKAAQAIAKHRAGESVQEDIGVVQKQIEGYTEFIFRNLEKERKIFDAIPKTTKTDEQRKRLDNLEKISVMHRRELGLDDARPGDRNADSFNFLVAVHAAPTGTPMAAEVLSIVSEPYTAVLDRKRAIPLGDCNAKEKKFDEQPEEYPHSLPPVPPSE